MYSHIPIFKVKLSMIKKPTINKEMASFLEKELLSQPIQGSDGEIEIIQSFAEQSLISCESIYNEIKKSLAEFEGLLKVLRQDTISMEMIIFTGKVESARLSTNSDLNGLLNALNNSSEIIKGILKNFSSISNKMTNDLSYIKDIFVNKKVA